MDYKALKLKASSSPHIRSNEDVRSIMLDVIIAMVPALVAAIYFFGFRALTVTVVSVAACVFFEWLYRKVMHKPQSIGDLSAVVTGMLLAFTCPVSIPYWMIVIGDAFAIIIVKQLYGGLGKNFMNPALGARAFLTRDLVGGHHGHLGGQRHERGRRPRFRRGCGRHHRRHAPVLPAPGPDA